jgi:hypothetical protein
MWPLELPQYMGHCPGPPSLVTPIYAMLQFNSVIQSLLIWLRQPHLFIGFDMHNDIIDFRHFNH